MSKYENQLYKLINEKYLGEDTDKKMTKEERRSFLEAVSNFHKLGEMIYSNAKLQEVTTTLKSVMEQAEKMTMQESEHWFDNVTVSRHMKQMNEAMKVFEKTAGEMNGLQQRLESAYEDMGTVLNRYYKINDALSEYTAGVDDNDPTDDPLSEYTAGVDDNVPTDEK
jgi:division protein CdvB (Snf7/Vps24/ESCRT-III family)